MKTNKYCQELFQKATNHCFPILSVPGMFLQPKQNFFGEYYAAGTQHCYESQKERLIKFVQPVTEVCRECN